MNIKICKTLLISVLVMFLEDPPLLRYVKNCPLNRAISIRIDVSRISTAAGTVRVYSLSMNRELLQRSNFLTNTDYRNWHDFTIAVRDLETILTELQSKS